MRSCISLLLHYTYEDETFTLNLTVFNLEVYDTSEAVHFSFTDQFD
jgi:hypothetical protein